MSALDPALERFATGRHVLVGDSLGTWVAVAAASINADRLERLEALGDGAALLGLTDVALSRLGLLAGADSRPARSLRATDAGEDRARTMRVAATSSTPADVGAPGHVDVFALGTTPAGVAAAHLATLAGTGLAVVLSVVVDELGHATPLQDARTRPDLSRLAVAPAAQLAAAALVAQRPSATAA